MFIRHKFVPNESASSHKTIHYCFSSLRQIKKWRISSGVSDPPMVLFGVVCVGG